MKAALTAASCPVCPASTHVGDPPPCPACPGCKVPPPCSQQATGPTALPRPYNSCEASIQPWGGYQRPSLTNPQVGVRLHLPTLLARLPRHSALPALHWMLNYFPESLPRGCTSPCSILALSHQASPIMAELDLRMFECVGREAGTVKTVEHVYEVRQGGAQPAPGLIWQHHAAVLLGTHQTCTACLPPVGPGPVASPTLGPLATPLMAMFSHSVHLLQALVPRA